MKSRFYSSSFFIPFLIYIYFFLIAILCKFFTGPYMLAAWVYSYFPILSLFVIYKYYLKKYFNTSLKKILLSIGMFLPFFSMILIFILPHLAYFKSKLIELEKLTPIDEFQLEELGIYELINWKGLIFLFLLALGGALMTLDEFLISKRDIENPPKKKLIFLIFISVLLTIGGAIVYFNPLTNFLGRNEEGVINLRKFFKNLSIFFSFYTFIFLLNSAFYFIFCFVYKLFKKIAIKSI